MVIVNPSYSFLEKDYENKNLRCANKQEDRGVKTKIRKYGSSKWFTGYISTLITTAPTNVFATDSNDGSFKNIYESVMNMFDWGVVLVIIFAGASWMLGHRSKGIEILIGAACGYLLARHAIDIRDWLKTI